MMPCSVTPFFCTPIGAQIIGWDNGIHYCFIKGFKEIVFCVNPETCCNYYVYPLAKDFTDFLRLLLSLKTTNAIQQVVWMDKDAFENFMNDPDEVRYTSSEPVQSILQNISSNLEVEPIENPFDYIKKLQKDFSKKSLDIAKTHDMSHTLDQYESIYRQVIAAKTA